MREARLWRESELGRLFTAVDEDGRPCVVRVVTTSRADDLDALWTELRRLPLPPTVEVVARWGRADGGRVWAVTPGIVEGTLADRLSVTGPLPAADVDRLAGDVTAALGELHAAGVVHGGVSPSTVVWTGERWQLTAAGLAPLLRPVSGRAEPVGEVSAYASPEVLAGRGATPADDLYAFGLTLAEAYRGTPVAPWRDGEPAAELLARRPPRPLMLPGAPPALVARIRALTPRPSPVADDDVQFTVYRPARVQPGRWYTMLAFAHKTDAVDDPVEGRIDPIEEVRRQAAALLGPKLGQYSTAVEDSSVELPRGSELLFVPSVEGLEFNPTQRSFSWEEPVHEESFRLRASTGVSGTRARGALVVFLGTVIIAEVSLSIAVDAAAAEDGQEPVETERARRYDRIFVSYSHDDLAVVERVKVGAAALGHEVVIDRTHLRSGQDWSAELEQLIAGSDVFQLFWSRNSMASRYVREEWTYALSLGRHGFIRPVYWEDPFPEGPDLPPQQLRRLHFYRLRGPEPEDEERRQGAAVPSAEAAPAAADPAAGSPPAPGSPPGPAGPGTGPPPPAAPRSPHRRSRAIVVATSVAAALGAVLTGGFLGGGTEPPPVTTPPTTSPSTAPSTSASTTPGQTTASVTTATTLAPVRVLRVAAERTFVCAAGAPRSTAVEAVVDASVPVSSVRLRTTLVPGPTGAPTTTAVSTIDMRPATPSQTYVATAGPFAAAGTVRLDVEVTYQGGTARGAAAAPLEVRPQCSVD